MRFDGVGVLLLALGCGAFGCAAKSTVFTSTPLARATERAYEPMYYEEYVVYHDADGMPFYWAKGVKTYVPKADFHFDVYMVDYRDNEAAYRRWEKKQTQPDGAARVQIAEQTPQHQSR